MSTLAIKRLISGGVITNYFCTSQCRHCLYNCSPQREKGYLNPQSAEKYLQTIHNLGARSVHVGGGEPLLRPEKLARVLTVANRVGVAVEYVETNSSWYKDPDSAAEILRNLQQKGLRTLLISISPFHNEYIPFSKVAGVIEACRKVGMNTFPWINGFIKDLTALDIEKPHPLEALAQKFGHDYLIRILQRYWVHLGGRALKTFQPVLQLRSVEEILRHGAVGCHRELTDTSHFHVDLFGNYIPGLCSGLSIGVDDLEGPLAPERYPVITMLAYNGVQGLLELAQKACGYTPARSAYINKCDLCTEIRAALVRHNFEGSEELSPAEFYQEIIE